MTKLVLFIYFLVWGCLTLGTPAYYLSIGYIDASDPVRWPFYGGFLGFLFFLSGIPSLFAAGILWAQLRDALRAS